MPGPNQANTRRMWVPQAIASVMLLWALNPSNPYGYYILLRWVCCGVFAFLAFEASEKRHNGWVWVLGITAAIYNPIIRVHLTREIWSAINIATIIVAIASIHGISATSSGNMEDKRS